MKESKDSWEKLVEDNTKLVYYVVNKLKVPKEYKEDTIGEGMVALVESAKKFDSSRGVKFSTYAVAWIQGRCKRFIREYRPMKFSRATIDANVEVVRYCSKNGIEFTDIDYKVLEEVGIDAKLGNEILDYGCMMRLESLVQSKEGNITVADTLASNESTEDAVFNSDEYIEDFIDEFFVQYKEKYNLREDDVWCCAFEDLVYNNLYGDKMSQDGIAVKYGYSQSYIARRFAGIKEEFREWIQERMMD